MRGVKLRLGGEDNTLNDFIRLGLVNEAAEAGVRYKRSCPVLGSKLELPFILGFRVTSCQPALAG